MSGSLDHRDWYTDPPWDDLVYQWITRYINVIRGNPGLAQHLGALHPGLELVPMPRALLQHVAIGAAPESTAAPTALDKLTAHEVERSGPQLIAAVRQFTKGIESGNIDETLKGMSKYTGAGHITELKTKLAKLFEAAKHLRIVPLKAANMTAAGSSLVGTAELAFEGEFGGEYKSGTLRLEFIFERAADGHWTIANVKSAE